MTTKMTNSHWGVVLLLSLIVLPGLLQAQSKVATTSAQFLGIAVGARAIGMGGAYVAEDADDAGAIEADGAGTAGGIAAEVLESWCNRTDEQKRICVREHELAR